MQNPFPSEVLYATSDVHDGNLSFLWGERGAVAENRRKFLAAHGVRPQDCAVIEAEHGERIVTVGAADRQKNIPAEALITSEKGVVLFLLVADCLPVAFYDPVHRVIALAHLGWKPTNLKLAQKVVAELARGFAAKPRDLHVSIGPGIRKESYRFTDPVQKSLPDWAPFLAELPTGETEVDIVGYNVRQLRDAGVAEANITVDPHDTAASPDYFSHYRAVRSGEPEGRFAAILALV